MPDQTNFFRIIYYFLDKPRFFIGLLLSFLGTGLGLILPQLIGLLMDQKFMNSVVSQPHLLLGMALFFVVVYIIQAFSTYLLGMSGNRAMSRMQTYLHKHLLGKFVQDVEELQAGDLASRLTNDMTIVLKLVTLTFPESLLNIFIVIGATSFLFFINFHLTVLSFILILFLLLGMIPINKKLENYYVRHQEMTGNLTGKLSHKFSHFRLIKTLKGEQQEIEEAEQGFRRLFHNFRKILLLSSFQSAMMNSLAMIFMLIIILVAGLNVQNGSMTISSLMAFVLYILQLLEPISELIKILDDLAEVNGVAKRTKQLLSKSDEQELCHVAPVQEGSISLKDVSFSYPGQKDPVLKNLWLDIPTGQNVAIIGPSGAGKTTLFSLLMKFYHHYNGSIRIGGQELRALSPMQVRQMICYVPQENTLFHGSLRDNLFYGKNKAVSEERLYEVLEELDLVEVVEQLPNGLDTVLSDSGHGLSEGQKQRFNIARALMSNGEIYLMDEVTANLDLVTEQTIVQAIDRLTVGKTRLTIAHRISTVQQADSILVLNEDGSLDDQGSHSELLMRNSQYQQYVSELKKVS